MSVQLNQPFLQPAPLAVDAETPLEPRRQAPSPSNSCCDCCSIVFVFALVVMVGAVDSGLMTIGSLGNNRTELEPKEKLCLRQCLQSTDPETCSKAADSSCVWLPFHNICQNSNVDFDKPEEKPTEENLDVGTDCVGLGLNNWVYTANDGSKHTADITLEDNFYLDVKGKQYFFIMPRTQAAMYPTPHDYTTVYDHMCSRKTTDGRNGYAACCKCLNPLHTKKMTSAAAEVYKYRIGHPKNNDSSCTAPPGPFILEQYARFSSQDGNTIFIESSWTTNANLSVIWQKENGDDPEANGEGEGSGEHERTKYDYRWYVPLNPEAQSEQEDELPFDCRPASPIAKMFGITLANPAGNANSATFNDHWVGEGPENTSLTGGHRGMCVQGCPSDDEFEAPNCKLLSKVQALYYLPGDIPSWLAPREEDGYSTKEERKFRQCFPDHLDVVMYRSLYLLFAAPGYATVAMVVLIAMTACCWKRRRAGLGPQQQTLWRKCCDAGTGSSFFFPRMLIRVQTVLDVVHWALLLIFFLVDFIYTTFFFTQHEEMAAPAPWVGSGDFGSILLVFAWVEMNEAMLPTLFNALKPGVSDPNRMLDYFKYEQIGTFVLLYAVLAQGLLLGYIDYTYLARTVSIAVYIASGITTKMECRKLVPMEEMSNWIRDTRGGIWRSRWLAFEALIWSLFVVFLLINPIGIGIEVLPLLPWSLLGGPGQRDPFMLQVILVPVGFVWCLNIVTMVLTHLYVQSKSKTEGVSAHHKADERNELAQLWVSFARDNVYFVLTIISVAKPGYAEAIHGVMAAIACLFVAGQSMVKECRHLILHTFRSQDHEEGNNHGSDGFLDTHRPTL